ncbi:MAG TPA: acyl-CoA synthetase, partial [Anaerolineae bacterium]|nr:acyl-CoA synthetase [Anaerolineae bacterium]
GDERVWAFVVPAEGSELSARDVLEYCRGALEPFKLPDQVRLVSSLPRSALGKVQKAELRAMVVGERGRERDTKEARRGRC